MNDRPTGNTVPARDAPPADPGPSPEKRLAQHVCDLCFTRIPQATRASIATLLLDVVACMLAGLRSAECARIARRALARGGAAQCSIAGYGERVPAASAGFVNAVYAHWYEWDDVYDPGGLHANAVIVPALFAAAEAAGHVDGSEPGETFVAALTGALDVAGRISAALTPWSASGWMPTGVASTVGAAAGAARLHGMDAAGVLSAMGIAGAGVGMSRQPIADRVDGKNVLCGLGVSRALEAAALAQDGIVGAPNFLSGPMGLNALVAAGRADPSLGLADLGERYCADEVSLKPYPSCRATHPVVDLALDLLAEQPIDTGAIERIEALVPQPMADMCGRPFAPGDNPRVAAQFSIAYTVARTLVHGKLALAAFDPATVAADPAVLALARRVQTTGAGLAPGVPYLGQPVTLRIHSRGAVTLTRTTSLVKGSPARPMSPRECEEKLADAARGALGPAEIAGLRDAVLGVHRHGIGRILAVLRSARHG